MKPIALSGMIALVAMLGTTGCIKKTLLKGQIASTREASAAIDTLGDYEVARGIAFGGIGQLEGMSYLAHGEDANALFSLTKSWAGVAFAFIEDEYEQAVDAEDDDLADYHKKRARNAYDRALDSGAKLLDSKVAGFQKARLNQESIRAYVQQFDDTADAVTLLWVGQAWLGRVNVAKDDPTIVAELFVGVALIERSVELDEKLAFGLGHTILGAYHARTGMAELDESKKEFDKALAINGGRMLMTKFQLARTLYCIKGDKASYEKTLQEVIDAQDPLPEQRLSNTIAKRRAKRYLSDSRKSNCGF